MLKHVKSRLYFSHVFDVFVIFKLNDLDYEDVIHRQGL